MNVTTNASTIRNWSTPGETSGASTAANQATSTSSSGSDLATKEVFLELLVAQIKNQNPLNPMDGVEFLSQLSQFTQVEQTLGMRQDLSKILTAIESGNTPQATSQPAATTPARP
jgi:flagellar basal-body rod modification protein FlgD